jgi:hypothetical protein
LGCRECGTRRATADCHPLGKTTIADGRPSSSIDAQLNTTEPGDWRIINPVAITALVRSLAHA